MTGVQVSKGYAAILIASLAFGCGSGGAPEEPSATGGVFATGSGGASPRAGASAGGLTNSGGSSPGAGASSGGLGGGSSAMGMAGQSSGGASSATGEVGGTTARGGAPSGGTASGGTTSSTEPDQLIQTLETVAEYDGAKLTAAYPVSLAPKLNYDPKLATGLEVIQGSQLALTQAELAKLETHGFVISKTKKFPNFPYGYKSIYAQDLPLYVSADSILNAVHHAFEDLLTTFERSSLSRELDQLLLGMRAALVAKDFEPPLKADLDLYLTLAHSLLKGKVQEAQAGADAKALQELFDLARAAQGHRAVSWFGSTRDEDFSQFLPRGHYATANLGNYFRAMMLLGRADLRLVETQSDGSVKFHRRQFDAALALHELVQEADGALWTHIDSVIGSFVGERDAMAPPDVTSLLAALGVKSFAEARALEDQRIQDEITRGGWGAQRIASRILVNGTPDARTLPLDRSFALFGQRYTVDSHVFVNTTFDRVPGRMMPSPLDAAFAALSNNAALELLTPELPNTSYVQGLAKSRVLVDAHEPAYWEGSLYTTWLSALRALSPRPETFAQLPSVVKTRAFQNRVLNTQLASWAELRHDTILYAKQSYTAGATCEFPDAYVDPYPELYARLRRFAERVDEIIPTLVEGNEADQVARTAAVAWVDNFKTAMTYLERMAKNQLTGMPHDQELLDFINEAVTWDLRTICATTTATNISGWYGRLFLDEAHLREFDPTIADVHTQPTDAGGADVGRVLHVGTGYPRLMVVTVETCNGPRAYAGLASSYAEVIEQNWTRRTDDDWLDQIAANPFPDVPWMVAVLAE